MEQSDAGKSEDSDTKIVDLVPAQEQSHDYETPITRCVAYDFVGVQESATSERPPDAVYETIT